MIEAVTQTRHPVTHGDACSAFVTQHEKGVPTQTRRTRHPIHPVTHGDAFAICRPFARAHKDTNLQIRHHASPMRHPEAHR